MNSHRNAGPGSSQVLVCMTDQRILSHLNALLHSNGVSVRCVSSLELLRDELTDGSHRLIVTVTAMIRAVRTMSELPMINIHAFVYAQNGGSGAATSGRMLDAEAFLKRIHAMIDTDYLARRAG
jgi:hypothetical protein